MSLRMVLFKVSQESGEHVVGQWCNGVTTENLDFCVGVCTLDAEIESQRTTKRAELTAFLSPQKNFRSYQGAC